MTSSICQSVRKFKLPEQQQEQQIIVHREARPLIVYKCRKKVIKLRAANQTKPNPKPQWNQAKTEAKPKTPGKLKMPRPRNKRLATPTPIGWAWKGSGPAVCENFA